MESEWPDRAAGYRIQAQIGAGSFGKVYLAIVFNGSRRNEKVAIKQIDLEKFPDQNMDDIRREMQIMRLCHHPNILNYHTVFLEGRYLWYVMPLFSGGSLGNMLRYRYSTGIHDEVLVAYILKETLQALSYFHKDQQIHRDVKASNMLIHADGHIVLSDFGVAAKMRDNMPVQTFAGSPCWMAPEIIDNESNSGYDCKADMWSFGITAIELVKGLPPFAELPAMKVIMMIISKEPPKLGRDDLFDPNFKEMVNSCLQKDPHLRPTAEHLMGNKFFRKAKGAQCIMKNLLEGFPSLESRYIPRQEESPGEHKTNGSNWKFEEEDEKDDFGIGDDED